MFNNLCLSNEADNLVEAVLCYSYSSAGLMVVLKYF